MHSPSKRLQRVQPSSEIDTLDGAFAFGGFWNHRAHPREGGAEAGGIFMKSTKIELFAVSGADANVHRQ